MDNIHHARVRQEKMNMVQGKVMPAKKRKGSEKKIFIPEEMMELVLDYKFQSYLPNDSEALRQLIWRGLIREKEQGNYRPCKGQKILEKNLIK